MKKNTTINKDWTGDRNSIFKTLGSSAHGSYERQSEDYYATEPRAVELLLEQEEFATSIWECASGEGHIAKVLLKHGYIVRQSDIIRRTPETEFHDFLGMGIEDWGGDIITNPPYRYAQEFVERALQSVGEGRKVAMFLRLLFLEGKARRALFESNPPKTIYVASGRLKCMLNGIDNMGGSAVAYAWFVWEKGYKGNTIVKWIN